MCIRDSLNAPVDTKFNIRVDQPDEYSYSAEAMNPSDDYFLNWIQITGRPNLIPADVSAQNKPTGIVFSETKIPGSKVNGLSKFSALDEDRLDDATGPLRSLNITSKTQSTGTVMLAISENETTSIYLGESQLQQASSGSQFLSVSKGVIGTKNSLQGSYGTVHPESIAINEGRAYWYDLKNATVVKYDSNGLKAIGDVKMKTYFKEKSDIIVSDTIDRFIPSTYDAYNNEYILTLPATGEVEVTTQGPGFYPSKPQISGTHKVPSGGNYTGDINVFINGFKNPINQSIGLNNGVGVVGFTAPNDFKIPANAITSPNPKENMTVKNAVSGGFGVDPNDATLFKAGTGALEFDQVPNAANRIDITLKEEVAIEPTKSVLVNNPLNYSSKFDGFNTTPIRLVTPEYSGITDEQKTLDATNGTLVIPFTSNFNFKLGDITPTTGFTYTKNGVISDIPQREISTNATAIGNNSSLHYYAAGSWNLTISGIDAETSRVDINSRKLIDPVISTVNANGITTTGFNMIGELESSGTGTIQERGCVYSSTNQNPDLNDTKCVDSAVTTGIFEKALTGLSSDTSYYFRAYAITELGTTFANTRSVTTGSTSNSLATVITDAYIAKENKAEGTITADGGATITRFGFVIGKNSTPVVGQIDIIDKAYVTVIPSFPYDFEFDFDSKSITLDADTTYYYRAYAINNVGTAYGVIRNFATPVATSGGIGDIELLSSTVSPTGGSVNFRVTKTYDANTVSGSITIEDTIGNSATVNVNIGSTETTDTVSYSIPRNQSSNSRNIGFTVTAFSPTSLNQTGGLPVLIKSTVSQGGTTSSGGGQELEEQY